MSAPVVSGVVALMLQKHPEWTPDQVKWILMNTTRSYVNQPANSAGIVQANEAVFYTGTPGLANQNLVRSPFLDPSTSAISYTHMSWSNMSWSNMSWSNNTYY
jgi:subtilisin family serine protease